MGKYFLLSQPLTSSLCSSHLVNNGVQESPPEKPSTNGSSDAAAGIDPRELFIDLNGVNVGFKHWHPMPVTQSGNKLSGQADMGGVWEWTSTTLEAYEGFEPMALYPGYTGESFASQVLYIETLSLTKVRGSGVLGWQAQCRAWGVVGDASPHRGAQDVVSGIVRGDREGEANCYKVSIGTSAIIHMSGLVHVSSEMPSPAHTWQCCSFTWCNGRRSSAES